MKFIKKFAEHTEYEAYAEGEEMVKPNVSYCKDANDVHYNRLTIDWSNEYFRTKALEDGTITLKISKTWGTDKVGYIAYSTDNGNNWTTIENQDDKDSVLIINVNVNEGNAVLWKGDIKQCSDDSDNVIGGNNVWFSSTNKFDVEGNIMSLSYGDNFVDVKELEYLCQFASLFNSCTRLINSNNLILPATTLSEWCYYSMFSNCNAMVSAPALPATTLAAGCYNSMFTNCKAMVSAPALPATTLANSCYELMFTVCIALTAAPLLPALELVPGCYKSMFKGCSSLNYVKAMFTSTSTTPRQNWLDGVAETGTFVRNSAATWNTSSLPSGWTVETAEA